MNFKRLIIGLFTAIACLIFNLLTLKAQEKSHFEPAIVTNVSVMLKELGLDDIIAIYGTSPREDEVLAHSKISINDLQEILTGQLDFTYDIFNAVAHKSASSSLRMKTRPSLQVIFYDDNHLGIDIDKWAPHWQKPWTVFMHIFCEALPHRVVRILQINKNAKTNQQVIAKMLVEWRREMATPKWQARINNSRKQISVLCTKSPVN